MKRLLLAALLFLLPAFAALAQGSHDPTRWNKSTEIYTRKGETWLNSEVFVNTYTGQTYPSGCLPDTWCTISLWANDVDEDAKSVFLSGILLITRGSTDETANLTIAFRKPGDPAITCGHYIGQAVISLFTGERSGFAAWVPVVNRQFQYCYRVSTGGSYPTNSTYGINVGVQARVK